MNARSIPPRSEFPASGRPPGAEIDKGRANATITLGRVLQALVDELEVRIVLAEGGLKG